MQNLAELARIDAVRRFGREIHIDHLNTSRFERVQIERCVVTQPMAIDDDEVEYGLTQRRATAEEPDARPASGSSNGSRCVCDSAGGRAAGVGIGDSGDS